MSHSRSTNSILLCALALSLSLCLLFLLRWKQTTADYDDVQLDDFSQSHIKDLLARGELRAAELATSHKVTASPASWQATRFFINILYSRSKFHTAEMLAKSSLTDFSPDYESLLIASGVRESILFQPRIQARLDSPEALLGKVSELRLQGRGEHARNLLKNVLATEPEHLHAQGWYGQILAWEMSHEFSTWNSTLPLDAESHPEIWFARGLAALFNHEPSLATACFREVLMLSPFHTSAASRLARSLYDLKLPDLARMANMYAEHLATLDILLSDLVTAPDCEMMYEVSDLFFEIGQAQLGSAWLKMAQARQSPHRNFTPREGNPQPSTQPLHLELLNKLTLSNNTASAKETDWNHYRFFNQVVSAQTPPSNVRFREITTAVQLDFQYQNGSLPEFFLGHILETTGGGVAAIDYDCDGWQDLYCAQGGNWRTNQRVPQPIDRFFRNLEANTVSDVTLLSGLGDDAYTQGVTAGDFNSDGFLDLYVCNFGKNRLYENLGDGTFLEVQNETTLVDDEWSMSAAFADLNGDGLADLYVVNYLDHEQVLQHPCHFAGNPRACPPTHFTGTRDRLYLNLGNGDFQEVSRLSGIGDVPGKGMGLVIADFNEDGHLEIFVGNDSEPNFYFTSSESVTARAPEPRLAMQVPSVIKFVEQGLVSGLATDDFGQAQATMGIAVGDVQQDGRLDLLVTNFYGESNTLYVQQPAGHFADRTVSSGRLQSESRGMLGFGTQLLDFDSDGDLDLIIANGHIDRTSVTGEPDAMLPQLFLNSGTGEFYRTEVASSGDYFQQPVFGRAITTLDWNRDGRTDLCLTHLDRPVAILQNETRNSCQSVSFKLVGITGERDAIGTTISVTCQNQTWKHQLTTGNGYLAANEKLITFGIGTHAQLDVVEIRWNSGEREVYTQLPGGRRYLCIEGQGTFEDCRY